RRAAERLSVVPLARVVASPLERTLATAEALVAGRPDLAIETDDALLECDYGSWTGRPLAELAAEPLWKVVQATPSQVVFPGGESMTAMSDRVVAAVRRHDAEVAEEHGKDAVWVVVSHGDLIKAVLAHALDLPLDRFQRLHVDPASLSIVRFDGDASSVLAVNTHAGDLSWLAKAPSAGTPAVGGGAGPEPATRKGA
ncbi:MAG: MSMEG_4193 family putative phosphomutase, partial [Nocardioides sp.]|uniref:MSMEG_4193 family putative phosphomutase n=1 Tax=Nocardioides sp. TaxID=35761 RepID=UPI0039E58647